MQIKKRNIEVHKKLNIATFILSSVFLVSYILFHYFVKETTYGGDGVLRYIYYTILISHIILAAGVLPLILLSFHRGLQMQVEKHKKLVRWSFPIWLYVTITGVILHYENIEKNFFNTFIHFTSKSRFRIIRAMPNV
jgi:putative membrane protein